MWWDIIAPPTPICTPNQIVNKTCIDNITVGYKQCSTDGYFWFDKTFVCATNQVCSNGECVAKPVIPVTPVCGNGVCEAGEDYINCPQDCPAPPAPVPSIEVPIWAVVAGIIIIVILFMVVKK
jgi:hypothetical protein